MRYALSERQLFQHRLSGVLELRKRVRPYRTGCFSLRFNGDVPTRQGHKRVDTYGFHPLIFIPFPWIVWRRPETGDRSEIGNGSRVTLPYLS